MANELVKALFTILKHCIECGDCSKCPMREQCGK